TTLSKGVGFKGLHGITTAQAKELKIYTLGSTSCIRACGEALNKEARTTATTLTAKLLILNLGEYDIWKNEIKARGTLLMTLPNKDQLKFHSYQDAKLLMEAIEKSTNSTSSTNEADNIAYGVSTAHTQGNTVNSTSVENLSDAVICDFLASHPNSPQLAREDSEQIDPDDLEEMDLHWEMAMLTIRARRALKNQKNRGREYGRKTMPVENPTENALIAQDGIGGSDCQVDSCSKNCLKAYATIKEQYDSLSSNYKKSQFNLLSYKAGLQLVEERLAHYKKNEAIFRDKINILNLEVKLRDNALVQYKKNLEKVKKERDELKLILEKYQNSSKSLNTLLESQVSNKDKTGLGYKASSPAIENFVNSSKMIENQKNVRSRSDKGYHAVPSPYIGNYIPPKPDRLFIDKQVESESVDVVSTVSSSAVKTVELKIESVDVKNKGVVVRPVWNNTKRVNHKNFANKMTHPHPKRRFIPQAILTKSGKLKTAGTPVNTVRPVNTTDSKPIVNYSRPISNAFKRGYLQAIRPFNKYSTYKKNIFNKEVNAVKASACWVWKAEHNNYDGGFVSFGDGKGRVSEKGKIKTGTLDFDDVYFCKELKYNLFRIKREFSVARTPQQNGVAKRKKRTLIEAARTIFLKNAPNVKGNEPDWLFDIDSLTISMNYVPVVAGYQTNGIAGTKDNIVAGQAEKKKRPEQEYILIPICTTDPLISQGHKDSAVMLPPVTTAGPSFANTASPSPINVAGTPANVEEEVDMNNVVSSYTIPDAPSANFLKIILKIKGQINKTLFIKRHKDDILLIQIYVDDIIFGSTKKELSTEFEKLMHDKFQMSSMRELYFFLGLQVQQKSDGIFISQDKYVVDILKKFDFSTVKTSSTPMEPNNALIKDAKDEDVDVHLYRSMIGLLMYLTASRHDITFAVCACARFQVTPKTSHLHAVKRIFRYLEGNPKLGLWYPKDSPFDLEAYSNSDYARASIDRKSTTGGSSDLYLTLTTL
nr:uncharacterized mitochondrial protein AtMg00810-like [Tanacetum cinerariifolium]